VSQRKTFPTELPDWAPPTKDDGKGGRRFGRFIHEAAQTRDDEVGRLCRRIKNITDPIPPFPYNEPWRVNRYFGSNLASSSTLATARKLVAEFRKWHLEGFELDLAEVARVNPDRAAQLREDRHESWKILDRLYEEDRNA
jgi:hypothetical protein